jgi:hypothetical protein
VGAVELSVTIVHPALDSGAPMWGDATEGWVDPAADWLGTLAVAGVPVRALADGADDGDRGLLLLPEPEAAPGLAERAAAAGRPLLCGPPPALAADRLAAVRDALGALVRPDLTGALLLRLDDPGAAVRRHLRGWAYPDVPAGAWNALWDALRGFGRVSVFCCPGWVDADGEVCDSRAVNPGEWAALDAGVAAGLADLECHGYTHLDPDSAAWARAPDRFDDPAWFRELWPPRREREPPWEAQAERIALWQAACGSGTALVAPGEGWGTETLRAARHRGLRLFCSWGICRLDMPVATWSRGVGSPYLDEADSSWFGAGLPVVGYWHDRDMAVRGPRWVADQLARRRDAGARRAWAFADLARAYATPVHATLADGEVQVHRAPPVPLLVERAPG